MNLTSIPDATILAWQATALESFGLMASGGRPVSVSYSAGDGSKAVTYSPASLADLRAWLAQLNGELARRGLVLCRPSRRAIGVRY